MIILDPDLEPDPAPRTNAVAPLAPRVKAKAPWASRIPQRQTLNRFLAEAQEALRLHGEVSVLLTTDRAIQRLNRQFRAKNKPTDVLSFPANGIAAEGIVGDLAISVETARRQAADHGHALSCELKVLILHGLLHLAGYDHEADTGKMARRERLLRARLNLPQGLIERNANAVPPNKAVILSDRTRRSPQRPKRKGVEGPASRDLYPATDSGCPILSRSRRGDRKGGNPQTSTSMLLPAATASSRKR